MLYKPVAGDCLSLYLAAREVIVSLVLLCQEVAVQQLIYFTSHLLKDVEGIYSTLEKLTLALVLTAHRLHSYFLSYPLTVLTNSALGQVLTNTEALVRLIKWVTELGEYNIQYKPRSTIKAQALIDFLVKVFGGKEGFWKISVDGSAIYKVSKVGELLVSPQRDELRVAVHLNFKPFNNKI